MWSFVKGKLFLISILNIPCCNLVVLFLSNSLLSFPSTPRDEKKATNKLKFWSIEAFSQTSEKLEIPRSPSVIPVGWWTDYSNL